MNTIQIQQTESTPVEFDVELASVNFGPTETETEPATKPTTKPEPKTPAKPDPGRRVVEPFRPPQPAPDQRPNVDPDRSYPTCRQPK